MNHTSRTKIKGTTLFLLALLFGLSYYLAMNNFFIPAGVACLLYFLILLIRKHARPVVQAAGAAREATKPWLKTGRPKN